MIEEFLVIVLGILIGTFTGLLPGSHINNLIPFFLSFSFLEPLELCILIISVAISQMIISFIPSVFLGAPNEENALSILPAHRLLLEGRGYEAVKLVLIGSLFSLFFTLLLISIFSENFKTFYSLTRPYIHLGIIFACVFMLFLERSVKKILLSLFILILSGIFGVVSLASPLVPQQNILFPVLTGLFGTSTILLSANQRSKIPEQEEEQNIKLGFKEIILSSFLGSVAGILAGFLPAIGVSQAAVIVQTLGRMGETRSFLVTLSGINIANEVFSLISLYLVGNPRSGASVAIQRILGELTFFHVLNFMGVVCFVLGIACILAKFLGRKIPLILSRINYKLLSYGVVIYISIMVVVICGINGLLFLFTSTSIGILTQKLGVKRSYCMGVLLIPSILFFSGLNPFVYSLLNL